MSEELRIALIVLGVLSLGSLTAGLGLIVLTYRSLRNLDVPEDADFFTTLRHVPLVLVVALDLIDLALDIFAAPLVWFLLDRLKLGALRNVAAVEALIPFTGPLPTFTVAWLAVRYLNVGGARKGGGGDGRGGRVAGESDSNGDGDGEVIETERVGPDRYTARR